MKMITTKVYDRLVESDKDVICLEGGSRSSKTTSIIQRIMTILQDSTVPKRVTICRKRLTWLKASVLETFERTLRDLGYWNVNNLHKTEMIYKHGRHQIRFVGMDETQKFHGMEQEILWINEAIEADQDDFDQAEQRTSDLVFLDYNPYKLNHWIYNIADNRPDVDLVHSTIFDNPFAPDKQRRKILSYEPTPDNVAHGTANQNKWEIYGLGIRGQVEGLVFPDYAVSASWPSVYQWNIKGLDFGFTNDPSALMDVQYYEGKVFLRQMIYQTGLNNQDLSRQFADLHVKKNETIVGDARSPLSINELSKIYGWNVVASKGVAGQGHRIIAGLDTMKQFPIVIYADSLDTIKEFDHYTYKKDMSSGLFLNKVEEGQADHAIDASRYGIVYRVGSPKPRKRIRAYGR